MSRKFVLLSSHRKFIRTYDEQPVWAKFQEQPKLFFSVEVQGESRDAEIELRQQNGHLAFALNQSKEENARIVAHVNDLNAEILDLRGQIAELNAAHEEERAGLEEAEFQRRLAVRLGTNLGYPCSV